MACPAQRLSGPKQPEAAIRRRGGATAGPLKLADDRSPWHQAISCCRTRIDGIMCGSRGGAALGYIANHARPAPGRVYIRTASSAQWQSEGRSYLLWPARVRLLSELTFPWPDGFVCHHPVHHKRTNKEKTHITRPFVFSNLSFVLISSLCLHEAHLSLTHTHTHAHTPVPGGDMHNPGREEGHNEPRDDSAG